MQGKKLKLVKRMKLVKTILRCWGSYSEDEHIVLVKFAVGSAIANCFRVTLSQVIENRHNILGHDTSFVTNVWLNTRVALAILV